MRRRKYSTKFRSIRFVKVNTPFVPKLLVRIDVHSAEGVVILVAVRRIHVQFDPLPKPLVIKVVPERTGPLSSTGPKIPLTSKRYVPLPDREPLPSEMSTV